MGQTGLCPSTWFPQLTAKILHVYAYKEWHYVWIKVFEIMSEYKFPWNQFLLRVNLFGGRMKNVKLQKET